VNGWSPFGGPFIPDVNVSRLDTGDAESCREAAKLHMAEIHYGLLPFLGPRFLARLYQGLAATPGAPVWLARDQGRVIGFLAGCTDIHVAYRHLMIRHAFSLALAAGSALYRPVVLRKIPALFLYPRCHRPAADASAPSTESGAHLLAIAVTQEAQGRGVGKQLVRCFEDFLSAHGVREYRVATNAEEPASNAFYPALGFQPCGSMRHHALTLRLYKKLLSWEK
jgi:GNAT superfamily N-acetyltransferase